MRLSLSLLSHGFVVGIHDIMHKFFISQLKPKAGPKHQIFFPMLEHFFWLSLYRLSRTPSKYLILIPFGQTRKILFPLQKGSRSQVFCLEFCLVKCIRLSVKTTRLCALEHAPRFSQSITELPTTKANGLELRKKKHKNSYNTVFGYLSVFFFMLQLILGIRIPFLRNRKRFEKATLLTGHRPMSNTNLRGKRAAELCVFYL